MVYLNNFDIIRIKKLLSEGEPFVANKSCRIADFLNKDNLLLNFYDFEVCASNNSFVVESNECGTPYFEDSDSVQILKLGNFIETYINKSNSSRYLKSLESEYDLLNKMGLDDVVRKDFLECKTPFGEDDISFWYGCKGTGSPFHYDDEDFNLLYVCEGVKKLYLINPKYNKRIQTAPTWHLFDSVIAETRNKILSNPQIPHEEVILQAGQIISIPPYWYHCVDNIEDTIAITYHFFS